MEVCGESIRAFDHQETDVLANVLIALQDHNTTALMMAVQYEQPELVEELVKHMSSDSVSAKDKLSRSALFFAAGNGDVRSTKALLKCRPRSNDGSLHEAARQLYPEILSMLLEAGHDPNFVSTIHDGLTPLGELATHCDASERRNDLEVCLEQLKTHKVDVLKQWRGKTALFLAMDNHVPYPVTSALLERLMNNFIDDERNIYRIKKLNFSPTMYLKKGNFAGNQASCRALIELLRDHGAIDRFFADAELDVQPKDAIGLPEPLRRAESARREHERGLQRAMEVHLQRLENDRQLKEQDLSYRELGQAQYVRHQEQNQSLYLEHQGQRFQQELDFGQLRHEHKRYQQQLTYEQGEAQRAQTAYEEHLEMNQRHHEELKQQIELQHVAQRERQAQLYHNHMSHKMEEYQRERRRTHRQQILEIDEEDRRGSAQDRASQLNYKRNMNKLQEMGDQVQHQHQANMQREKENHSRRQYQMSLGYATSMNEIAQKSKSRESRINDLRRRQRI